MADKQDRYRQRKTDQGFKRVEVLVPFESIPYLKAYARALRDAHELGLERPLFQSMGQRREQEHVSINQPENKSREIHEINKRPDFSGGLLDKR